MFFERVYDDIDQYYGPSRNIKKYLFNVELLN